MTTCVRRTALIAMLVTLGALVMCPDACRADGEEMKKAPPPENSAMSEAVMAIKKGDFPGAIKLLEVIVGKDGKNADAYNLLGYATRNNGDANAAIPIYQKALTLDPKHKGANEYIGEAYLVLGDVPKAKEHLAVLNKLCFLPCDEYANLKKAIQAYESSGGKVTPASQRNRW
jgi:tetratricopeptide (TPR) repeat protein